MFKNKKTLLISKNFLLSFKIVFLSVITTKTSQNIELLCDWRIVIVQNQFGTIVLEVLFFSMGQEVTY